MKKLILTCLILASVASFGQKITKDKSYYYDYGKNFFAEAIVVPTNYIDSSDIIALFRISNSTLTYEKNTNPFHKEKYLAVPYVYLDVRDNDGIIKNRSSWSDSIFVNDFDDTKSKSLFIYGSIKKRVYNGRYSLSLELNNQYSTVLSKARIDDINAVDFYKNESITKPIFTFDESSVLSNAKSKAPKYQPYVLEGNISFSPYQVNMFALVSIKSKNNIFDYKIDYIPERLTNPWEKTFTYSGTCEAELSSGLVLDVNQKSISVNSSPGIYPSRENQNKIGILNIQLPSDRLFPGKFVLSIYQANRTDTLKINFNVNWYDMPLSLKNPEYAADLMLNILTEDQYDKLKEGSKINIYENIIKYWKTQDPTPYTEYNEAMTEFFRRADFAFFNFQTVEFKDGAKSERGKIYLLYGKPTKIESSQKEGKSQEVWTYNNLKKLFYFETNSAGQYILKEIKKF